MPFITQGKTNLKYILIVVILAAIVGGGILGYYYLWIKDLETRLAVVELKMPEKVIADETANWKIYINGTFGFEFKYPSNLSYSSMGPNSVQQQINNGEQISGTVEPSYDTINFSEQGNEQKFSVGIFHKTDTSLTPSGYNDGGLFLSGACDLRWMDSKPNIIKNNKVNDIEILEVKIAETNKFLGCYCLKNKAGNLIVFSTASFKDQTNFQSVDKVINTILATLKLTGEGPGEDTIVLNVVQLKTDYGFDTTGSQYSYPSTVDTSAPKAYEDKLGAYGAAEKVIVGPKGWTGEGFIAADGSGFIGLYPFNGSTKQGSRITVTVHPACVGCALGAAAPFFPEAKSQFEKDFPGPVEIPSGLKIQPITKKLIGYSLSNTPDGLEVNGVAYFEMNSGQPYFIQMEVTLPSTGHDLSTVILNLFIQRQGLDK